MNPNKKNSSIRKDIKRLLSEISFSTIARAIKKSDQIAGASGYPYYDSLKRTQNVNLKKMFEDRLIPYFSSWKTYVKTKWKLSSYVRVRYNPLAESFTFFFILGDEIPEASLFSFQTDDKKRNKKGIKPSRIDLEAATVKYPHLKISIHDNSLEASKKNFFNQKHFEIFGHSSLKDSFYRALSLFEENMVKFLGLSIKERITKEDVNRLFDMCLSSKEESSVYVKKKTGFRFGFD